MPQRLSSLGLFACAVLTAALISMSCVSDSPAPLVQESTSPPSAQPTVTTTVAPTRDPRIAAYTNAIVDIGQRHVPQLDALQSLMGNPRITDATWRTNIRDQASSIKTLSQEARRLEPPPCLAAVHAEWVKSWTLMEQASDAITTGLNSLNLSTMNSALPAIQESGVYMGRTTEQLRSAAC